MSFFNNKSVNNGVASMRLYVVLRLLNALYSGSVFVNLFSHSSNTWRILSPTSLYSCSVMNASSSGIPAVSSIFLAFSHFSLVYGSFTTLVLSSGVSHVIFVSTTSFTLSTTHHFFSSFGLPVTGSPGSTVPGSATLPPCLALYLSMKLCLNSSTHLFTILLTDFPTPVSPSGPMLHIFLPHSLYRSVASFTLFISALVCSFAPSTHLFSADLN